MKASNFLLQIYCLLVYLKWTWNYGKIVQYIPKELVTIDLYEPDTVRHELPVAIDTKSPDLPGPIFFRLLKNRLEDGQENQLYFGKGHQYIVIDKLTYIGYQPYVMRSIAMAEFKTAFHSTSILRMPKGPVGHGRNVESPFFWMSGKFGRSIADTDTRNWDVMKEAAVWGGYEYSMLDSIFSTGAVPRNRNATANILSVGLGGSSFNNYMDEVLPNFNITVVELEPVFLRMSLEWFQLETSKRHDVIIEDGVKFIDYAVKKGIRYDAILLDATHSVDFFFTVSPVKVFYEDKTLANMATLLGRRGSLIVNVMFGRQYDPRKASKMLVDIFKKYFRHVEMRNVLGKRNMVLIARQIPIPFLGKRRRLY